jgi:hypothetical protein
MWPQKSQGPYCRPALTEIRLQQGAVTFQVHAGSRRPGAAGFQCSCVALLPDRQVARSKNEVALKRKLTTRHSKV